MRKQWFVMLAGLLALLAVFTGGAPVHAEEVSCSGRLGAITVDNLRVPSGKTCTLEQTRVKGTIVVNNGATLIATGARVVGNIQAEGAKLVKVTGGTVGGSIQVVQGGSAAIKSVKVTGDILFDENKTGIVALKNTVSGNVQAFQNLGGVKIAGNTIDGNLQCKENSPRPTGGNNVVDGSKEDQCAKL